MTLTNEQLGKALREILQQQLPEGYNTYTQTVGASYDTQANSDNHDDIFYAGCRYGAISMLEDLRQLSNGRELEYIKRQITGSFTI